jgi:hypothetical protein
MTSDLIPAEYIENRILMLRNQKVMLSSDLAELYEVEPKVLVQAVKRNAERFPEDFMFQLDHQEVAILKSQFVTSSWGGQRKPPYAFTEELEKKYDKQFRVVFDALREMMNPPEPPSKQIGFGVRERQARYRVKGKKTS